MLEKGLRTIAIFISAAVLASFMLFAIDQTRDASTRTQEAIAAERAVTSASAEPADERAREAQHTTVREAIDDINDHATSPFAGLVSGSHDRWVRRGVPALLALLVWGLGLGYLARYMRGRSSSGKTARVTPTGIGTPRS